MYVLFFLYLFILDTKLQGTKCGTTAGHEDEDLFKERLRNMGKGILFLCIIIYYNYFTKIYFKFINLFSI